MKINLTFEMNAEEMVAFAEAASKANISSEVLRLLRQAQETKNQEFSHIPSDACKKECDQIVEKFKVDSKKILDKNLAEAKKICEESLKKMDVESKEEEEEDIW